MRKGWPHRQLRLELKLNYAFDKVQVPLRETSKPKLRLSTLLRVRKVGGNNNLYRSEQSLRFPGGGGSQISRQSAHEGGNLNICVFHHVVYNRSIFMYQKPSYTTMFAKSNK